MNIAILSRKASLYSTRRLIEAAKERGHTVHVIDYLRCYMNITSSQGSVHYKGEVLPPFDVIIPRIGAKHTFYGSAVVRHFEACGSVSINPSIAITRSRDKLRSLQLLSREGIGLPRTGFASSTSDVDDLIKTVGGAPLVVKLIEGTQGVGVVMAETKKAAESVIEAFMGLNANIIIQEFIKEANGADIRCFVIGDKVVASMQRQAQAGDFRSNLHQGGTASVVEISEDERKTAIQAAKIMGLKMAGVDLLRSQRGPLVMEVNSSPGLEGIEKTSGIKVAEMIIAYLEEHTKNLRKSPYQG